MGKGGKDLLVVNVVSYFSSICEDKLSYCLLNGYDDDDLIIIEKVLQKGNHNGYKLHHVNLKKERRR